MYLILLKISSFLIFNYIGCATSLSYTINKNVKITKKNIFKSLILGSSVSILFWYNLLYFL